MNETEAIAHTRALMREPGTWAERDRRAQAFWTEWTAERDRPALKHGECEECGAVIERERGRGGSLPKRCPACKAGASQD